MRVVTNEEMQELDRRATEEFEIPSIVLMENAGSQAAKIIAKKHQEQTMVNSDILILAGKGRNGGDALVVARHLLKMGKSIRLFLLHSEDAYKGTARTNLNILLKERVWPVILENIEPLDEFFGSSIGPFIAVDGLLGTGFRGPLAGLYADVVDIINKRANYVIALDIPTGVDGNTGAVVGQCIDADMTIAFEFPKLGHYISPGAFYRGSLEVADISFPRVFHKEGSIWSLEESSVASLLKFRDRYGHKNSFGHCLLIGGSPGRLGAICMAARSCLRMGTGLVTVSTWQDCCDSLMNRMDDEIMITPFQIEGKDYIKQRQEINNFSSIVIGPGLGTSKEAQTLLKKLMHYYNGPLVIDADGINLLANEELKKELSSRKGPTVLTPHLGEMARMMGVDMETVRSNPIESVRTVVRDTNTVTLLKGACTFIGTTDDKIFLNHYPNDGMATAGSGDVLAGMLGGLLGQEINTVEAVCLGVYIHSLAGKHAAKELGHRAMTASDLTAHLGDSFLELRRYRDSGAVQ